MPPVLSKPTRCDACIERERKCDGAVPCSFCFDKTRLCTYGGISPVNQPRKTRAKTPSGPRSLADRLSSPVPVPPEHNRTTTEAPEPSEDELESASDEQVDESLSLTAPKFSSSDAAFSDEAFSDTDSYIRKLPPSSPIGLSEADYPASQADSSLFSEPTSAGSKHPLRIRGGAIDAGSDQGPAEQEDDDIDPNLTQEQLIRALAAEQAKIQRALAKILDDKKRKNRDVYPYPHVAQKNSLFHSFADSISKRHKFSPL